MNTGKNVRQAYIVSTALVILTSIVLLPFVIALFQWSPPIVHNGDLVITWLASMVMAFVLAIRLIAIYGVPKKWLLPFAALSFWMMAAPFVGTLVARWLFVR